LGHLVAAFARAGGATVLGGLFTGAAFSSYAIALNHTEVVRVLLLFYVTPIWSTLIGLAVLGERLTLSRLAALALALLGLVVILGTRCFCFVRATANWRSRWGCLWRARL